MKNTKPDSRCTSMIRCFLLLFLSDSNYTPCFFRFFTWGMIVGKFLYSRKYFICKRPRTACCLINAHEHLFTCCSTFSFFSVQFEKDMGAFFFIITHLQMDLEWSIQLHFIQITNMTFQCEHRILLFITELFIYTNEVHETVNAPAECTHIFRIIHMSVVINPLLSYMILKNYFCIRHAESSS